MPPSRFGGVTDSSHPEMFFTYRQWDWNVSEVLYVVRVAGDPRILAPGMRAIISEENPSLTLQAVATMEDLLMDSLARPRAYALLIAGFAMFATAIAVAGLFGVLSLLAAQRTREIGVRTTLGAEPGDIVSSHLERGGGSRLHWSRRRSRGGVSPWRTRCRAFSSA